MPAPLFEFNSNLVKAIDWIHNFCFGFKSAVCLIWFEFLLFVCFGLVFFVLWLVKFAKKIDCSLDCNYKIWCLNIGNRDNFRSCLCLLGYFGFTSSTINNPSKFKSNVNVIVQRFFCFGFGVQLSKLSFCFGVDWLFHWFDLI